MPKSTISARVGFASASRTIAPFSDSLLFLDLFNCNDGSSLEQLPAEIVATNEQFKKLNNQKTTINNDSLRFKGLSRANPRY